MSVTQKETGQEDSAGELAQRFLGGLFSVFIFFLAKDILKTQMWESQLQVCSIANYYESPLSSISERPFVLWLSQSCLSTIGVEIPKIVAWLFLWQDVYSAQIKVANIFQEPSGVQALQCASKCFSPPECPSGMEATGREGLFWILLHPSCLAHNTYSMHILSVSGISQ